MKKKTKALKSISLILFAVLSLFKASGQLTLSGQVRTRTEYRNGLGTLKPKTNDAAFFTSQRSRLTFNYKTNRVILQTSVQDVRVWGQDASTISNADGNKLGIHEAWAEIILANKKDSSFTKQSVEYFALKIGRQELLYDDSRLLGNLDWLQQARRHDAAVLKFANKGWQVDAGFAFNQNTDAFNYNGTYYTPVNVPATVKDSKGFLVTTPNGLVPLMNGSGMSSKTGNPSFVNPPSTNGMNQVYKSLQFLYAAKTFKSTKVTGLFLADHFGKYNMDSVQTSNVIEPGYVYGRRFNQKGVHSRITTGVLVNSPLNKTKSLALTAGFYYQAGKDKDGADLSAYTSTLALALTKGKFSYTAGWDYVSGNDAISPSGKNNRFDPLYGTPHKFWGYMDYFYVGTGSPTGGLSDPFFKIKYASKNKRFSAGLDYHYFSLAKDQKDINGNAIDKYLGSEFDLVTTYAFNKMTSVEWGFSAMAATKSMEYAKGIIPNTANLTGTWSYLMIAIKPEFLFK
ncbi:MAG: alginate export family protein [Chitinophagaceae bacterium]